MLKTSGTRILLARNLQHLQLLEEVENLAFNILLSIIVVAWAATAACRLLYGRQTWNFLNSIRTVCRLNLLTHLIELCGYLTLLGLMLFLAGHSLLMWELNHLKLKQELFTEIQLLMLAPLSAIFPSSVSHLIQMLQAPPIPARTRACGMCCRLKKWQWAWSFCLSVFWHALASTGALISVILPLNSIGNQDRPGFELAMRRCRQEMIGLCQTTDWRQVPDTRWETHLKCALDCSDVKIPAEDVYLHFYSTAYKLVALCSSCSLLSKSFLLWISCRILKIARRTVHTKTTNASSETQPEREAEAAEPQATLAAVPGVSGNANEAVLTPSLFQQGAVSARTPRTPRSQGEATKSLEVAPEDKVENGREENLELSDEGKIRQQQILEAAMSLPQPPSPSGSVASLNFKPQATAAEIRKMLENPLADGHAELVDFAKSIARECTKDSATSNGSASSSRSRRARG